MSDLAKENLRKKKIKLWMDATSRAWRKTKKSLLGANVSKTT